MMILPASAVKLLTYKQNFGHEDQRRMMHISHFHSTNTVASQDLYKYWDDLNI